MAPTPVPHTYLLQEKKVEARVRASAFVWTPMRTAPARGRPPAALPRRRSRSEDPASPAACADTDDTAASHFAVPKPQALAAARAQ
jgi:hypothetical protein